jgi:hypothetical protein
LKFERCLAVVENTLIDRARDPRGRNRAGELGRPGGDVAAPDGVSGHLAAPDGINPQVDGLQAAVVQGVVAHIGRPHPVGVADVLGNHLAVDDVRLTDLVLARKWAVDGVGRPAERDEHSDAADDVRADVLAYPA